MKTYLFACVHNAGRSQMSAAFFNALANPVKARAISAGTSPGDRLHPEVIAAMQEVGIDLSRARPQKLTESLARTADLLGVERSNLYRKMRAFGIAPARRPEGEEEPA